MMDDGWTLISKLVITLLINLKDNYFKIILKKYDYSFYFATNKSFLMRN